MQRGEHLPIEDDPFDLAEQHGSRIICAAVDEARTRGLSPERRGEIVAELTSVLPPSSLAWHVEHLARRLAPASR